LIYVVVDTVSSISERSLDEVPSTRGDPESSNSESPKRTTISIINASNKIVPTGQRGGVLERFLPLE